MIWYKIYRLVPPRRFGESAQLVEDSNMITMDPDHAVELFRSALRICDSVETLGKSSNELVLMSVQKKPDASARGTLIYKSNSAGKVGRSRITPHDRRIVMPASRAYGKLVASSWGWHPKFINGVEELVEAGEMDRAMADQVLAGATPADREEARRVLQRASRKKGQALSASSTGLSAGLSSTAGFAFLT